ncbi:MAG: hypothetical protein JSV77_01835 [Dehalococcoidales bacterium]|nr:MAG: hypothetical protein JSV77_01835 [Dehalococcoidales bacterium]
MPDYKTKLKGALLAGAKKGWGNFLWICKIIIPVSLLVALLQWSSWLYEADVILKPLMGWLNLPSEAALPIISGLVINLYATMAAITVVPFTVGQMTLIAIFSLIAHNLIIEGIIQHRSGVNVFTITLVRISAAILTVLVVSQFIGDTSESIAGLAEITEDSPIGEVLKEWTLDTLLLLAKVFAIIMFIMIVLESLMSLGWSEYLFDFSRPLMKLLGLSRRTAMLWVTAVIFGLMYGGAVIQDEVKRGDLTKTELRHLHVSIGINHSMVEDPALFMALGLNGFWLWIPKLVMAAVVVHVFRAFEYLWGRTRRARDE